MLCLLVDASPLWDIRTLVSKNLKCGVEKHKFPNWVTWNNDKLGHSYFHILVLGILHPYNGPLYSHKKEREI